MKTLAARLALLAVFLSIPVLSGCGSVDKDYREADRLTLEDLREDVTYGIKNNPATDADTKARHLRTLATWELRTNKADGK